MQPKFAIHNSFDVCVYTVLAYLTRERPRYFLWNFQMVQTAMKSNWVYNYRTKKKKYASKNVLSLNIENTNVLMSAMREYVLH